MGIFSAASFIRPTVKLYVLFQTFSTGAADIKRIFWLPLLRTSSQR